MASNGDDCPTCNGSGNGGDCNMCGGTGKI